MYRYCIDCTNKGIYIYVKFSQCYLAATDPLFTLAIFLSLHNREKILKLRSRIIILCDMNVLIVKKIKYFKFQCFYCLYGTLEMILQHDLQ